MRRFIRVLVGALLVGNGVIWSLALDTPSLKYTGRMDDKFVHLNLNTLRASITTDSAGLYVIEQVRCDSALRNEGGAILFKNKTPVAAVIGPVGVWKGPIRKKVHRSSTKSI